jgi:hypothetical protein
MDVQVVLSSDEIVRGLKHYRRIAKQDILRAPESPDPDASLRHAEARREVYAELAEIAERGSPAAVVDAALDLYRNLPFAPVGDDQESISLRARENALENFFLMIGLEPKIRREARNQRPPAAGRGGDRAGDAARA